MWLTKRTSLKAAIAITTAILVGPWRRAQGGHCYDEPDDPNSWEDHDCPDPSEWRPTWQRPTQVPLPRRYLRSVPTLAPEPTPTPTPRPAAGAKWLPLAGWWQHITRIDALDGIRTDAFFLEATERSGYGRGYPRLLLMCLGGSLTKAVIIDWKAWIGYDNNEVVPVAHRISDEYIAHMRWVSLSDNVTLLDPSYVESFLEDLGARRANHKLVARVRRFDDQSITATWNFAGARVAVAELTDTCNSRYRS